MTREIWKIDRSTFRTIVREVAENPTDFNIGSLTDDLGYLEILVKLASVGTDLDHFNDSEPLFLDGKINWPPALAARKEIAS